MIHQNPTLQAANLDRIARRQTQITRARNVVSPLAAANMAALAYRAPNLNAGQVAGLGLAGITADDPAVEQAVQAQMEQQAVDLNQPESFIDRNIYDPFKGIIRTGMTLLGGFMEEMEGLQVRSPVAGYQQMAGTADYGQNPFAAGGRSDAFHSIRELLSGKPVNLGEGFFANSTVSADVQHSLSRGVNLADAVGASAQQQQLGMPTTLQGQLDRDRVQVEKGGQSTPISLGRLAALSVTEPGTQSFHYMSGMLDFAKQVALDPADYLLGGAGKVRLLTKVPVNNVADLSFMSRALAKTPIGGSARKAGDQLSWQGYLNTEQGGKWTNWFAEQTGAEGARNIRDLLQSSRRGGSVDPADVRKLVNETDPHKVQNILTEWGGRHQGRLRDMPQTFGAHGITGGRATGAGLAGVAGFQGSIMNRMIPGAEVFLRTGSDVPLRTTMRDIYRDSTEFGAGFVARQRSTGTYLGRMSASVGSKVLNVSDEREAVDSLDEYMKALQTPDDMYTEMMGRAMDPMGSYERMKALGEADDYTLYNHYFSIIKDVTYDFAARSGMEGPELESISRIFRDTTEFRTYWKNNIDEDMIFGGANVTYVANGQAKAMPSAVLISQFLDQSIPLMDLRKVRGAQRRAWVNRIGGQHLEAAGGKIEDAAALADDEAGKLRTGVAASGESVNKTANWLASKYGPADYDDIGEAALINMADFAIGKVWKPAVLLRVAWPVRVIGEEQLRLGAAELAGVFNHPMQYYSLVMARKTPFLRKMARASEDVFNRDFKSPNGMEDAMATQRMSYAESLHGGRPIRGYESVNKADLTPTEVANARVHMLNQLAEDPMAQAVLDELDEVLQDAAVLESGFVPLTSVKERFWNGDLQHIRETLLQDSSRFNELANKAWADEYVDNVYAMIVHQTGGDLIMSNTKDNMWRTLSGEVVDPPSTGASHVPTPNRDSRLEPLTRQRDSAVRQVQNGNISVDEAPMELEELLQHIADANGVNVEDMNRSGQVVDMLIEELEAAIDMNADWDDAFLSGVNDLWNAAARDLDDMGIIAAPKAPGREYMAAQEALHGTGALSRENFVGGTTTIPEEYLGASGMGLRGDATDARTAGKEYAASQMETFAAESIEYGDGIRSHPSIKRYEDLASVPENEILDLAAQPALHPGTGSMTATEHAYAIMAEDGRIGAYFQFINDVDGKLIAVPMLTSDNPRYYKRLLDALVEDGIIDMQDVLEMHTSGTRLIDAVRDRLPNLEVNTYEDLQKFLNENPDSVEVLKDILPGMRMAGTDTTEAGSRLSNMGMRQVRKDAPSWSQDRPAVKVNNFGDPNLRAALRKGDVELEDGSMFNWGNSNGLKPKDMKEVHARRTSFLDTDESYATAPQFVTRPVREADAKTRNGWDKSIDYLYGMLMSKPTDFLSRSPAYRQFYWRRVSALMDETDEATYQTLMANAKKANVVDDDKFWMNMTAKPMRLFRSVRGNETAMDGVLRRLGKERTTFSDDAMFAGDVGMREIDELAKAYALEETKRLLYDMSESHMWADQLRHIMPFAEAWFEVMSTWARLVKENPRVLNRMRQGIEGARDSNPFAGVNPDGEQDHGLFYRNPETGEEMFAYPGSGMISSAMFGDAGQNIQLEGRANALNIAAGVMPGIGPLVQMPLSQTGWADDPDNRELRDILLPFGKSTVDIKNPASWMGPATPGWFQKGLAGFFGEDANTGDQQRLYHNTMIDVYKTLVMQGWDVSSEEGIQAALAEAGRIAKDVYKIRSLAQFAGPAGAGVRFQVAYDINDETGTLWSYQALSTEYRRLMDENSGDAVKTYQQFTNMFGVDPMLFSTSKTQKVLPRAVTLEARKWEHDNPDLFEDFPRTAYYANPDPIDGKFDYETYLYTLNEDARQELTPDQWAHKRNQFLGRIAYDNFQREADKRFSNNPQIHSEWLRRQYQSLVTRYPGYGTNIPGLPETPSLDDQIRELYTWNADERLHESHVGQTLSEYLTFRDRMIALTQSQFGYTTDTGFRTGKRAVLYRQRLRQKGEQLVTINPDFLPVWEQILSREIQEPDWTQQPLELAGVSF